MIIVIVIGLVAVSFRGEEAIEVLKALSGNSSTSQTNSNLSINYYGAKDGIVSRPFKDGMQACWYYHANYKNLHPYTLLWEKSKKVDTYLKIRVIANPAYWYAQSCIKDEGKVKLIGIEYTKHAIEVQLNKDEDFIHIASSNAYYQSELLFDNEGRINARKVLKSDINCVTNNFDCKTGQFIGALEKKNESDGGRIRREKRIKELKEKNSPFNELEIIPTPQFNLKKTSAEEYKKYVEATQFYIEERNKLHQNLAEEGCGVISIEPEPKKETGILIKPSIAFLCFKESESHVRLMQRE